MIAPARKSVWLLALALATANLPAQTVTLSVLPNTAPPRPGNLPARTYPSVPEAVAAARALRPGGVGPEVVILLQAGRHRLDLPLQFGPEDSRLTLAAARGARPVITTARRLEGWQPVPGHESWWQTTVPEVREGKWYFRSLFVDGQRAVRARTPNVGQYFRMAGQRFSDDPARFRFRGNDLRPEWVSQPDLEVVGFEKWTSFRQHLRALDAASNAVTLSFNAAAHTHEDGAQYFVENTPDALDAPGEWHLDRATGVLTYVAPPRKDPRRMEILAPVLTEFVRVNGDLAGGRTVDQLTFRGLAFAHTDWTLPPEGQVDVQAAVAIPAAITAQGAKDLTLEDCTFEHLGGYAVDLGRGCDRGRVLHCTLRDLGAGGVKLGEPSVRSKPAERSGNHVVADCEMVTLGRVNPTAVGVLILQSGGNEVVHNEIHDLYYTAVSVGWTWGYQESPCRENRIEYNHLHDIGLGLLSDMGAIYTLGPQPGTLLRNNLIHDVESSGYGGWGLYTDEGSSGILLESNVVYRCKSAGFHQHYGRENVVRNNVIALNREHELMRSREEEHLSFFFTNNVVYFTTGDLLGSSWRNHRFVMDRNVYFDTRLATNLTALKFSGQTLEQWREAGHDVNSVLADPRFKAPQKLDFRLRSDSPALKLGFQPPDVSQVGPRRKP
jgi:hypothetical protein